MIVCQFFRCRSTHDQLFDLLLAVRRGLGKTLQTISLLAYLRESRGVTGPHLCIVPKSVTGNWIREFRKWCPSIRAVKMGGTKEERQKFIDNDLPIDPATGRSRFDVLVTSYEGLLKEKGRLSKIRWRYVLHAGSFALVGLWTFLTLLPLSHGSVKVPDHRRSE